jgi:predicted nucleic acid-binding protein
MFTSPVILAEYEEVLRRPRLKLDPARIAESLAVILKTSTEVVPIHSLKISKHDADNRFYECADVADADYVIAGDTNRSVNTQSMIFSSCLIVYPSITQLRSFEPGEDWGWCYVDQVMRELSPIPEA